MDDSVRLENNNAPVDTEEAVFKKSTGLTPQK